MRNRRLVFLAVFLVGASAAADVDDLVRAGNEAFQREAYEEAIALYVEAERRSTDPGLVAFNKGAALYRLGHFRDAELHYLRCLEDAAGERRARVLYDLGNAVLRQARRSDAALLDRAIGHFEECLRQPEASDELLDNARFNLELARTLRLEAKTDPDSPKQSDPDKPKANDKNGKTSRTTAKGKTTSGDPDKNGTGQRPLPDEPGPEGKTSAGQRSQPGVGNLPPIPDDEQVSPMPRGDAAAHLRNVAERIVNERKKQQQGLAPRLPRNVRDW